MSIQIILTGESLASLKNDVLALASSLSGTVTTVAETPAKEPKKEVVKKDEPKKEEPKSEPKKDPPKKEEPKKEEPKADEANAAKLKALRELGMKFVTDQRSAELKELTAKFGIDKVSNAPVEKYDELLAAMTELYNNSAV